MLYQYNHRNASLRACQRHADIFFDGFSDEYFMTKMFPGVLEKPNPVRSKIAAAWAREQHLKLLSGRYALFNMDDIATAFYALPRAAWPRLTLLQKLRHWAYGWWYYIVDACSGFPLKWYVQSPKSLAWWSEWDFDVPDNYQHLAALSFNQLKAERYPQRDLLWLAFISVRKNTEGKGYGSQLLEKSLAHFKGTTTEFKFEGSTATGPAKVGLYPTKGNHTFYERFGFETVLSKDLKFQGETFRHRMMQRVI